MHFARRAAWILLAASTCAAAIAPCTTAGLDCIEKVSPGSNAKYSKIYRSFPLTEKNAAIERALIVIHGAGRDAHNYFASAVAAALIAGALQNSIILAPRFASTHGSGCSDQLDADEISWTCGGDEDWRGGGAAAGISGLTTFDLVDHLVRKLARREIFPNLRVIVVTGHSAGGQFVSRYLAASRAEKNLGVPVKYVVANPSSYLYLDNVRLAAGSTCSERGGCTGEFNPYPEGRNCTTYNQWRYGLEKRTGYAAAVSDEDLRRQLIARDVTYLLGEFDTLPVYGFDGSCPAMAQGPSRLARGLNYWNYLHTKYAAQHRLIVVPACGHNGRCIYTADVSHPVLFPK
jgi:pimeloyl-ACP methyl ester carboxylesterase